jgi:hypothetical protein
MIGLPTACGPNCTDCTGNVNGSACFTPRNRCGCYAATDCPVGYACDLSVNLCTTTCADPPNPTLYTACNGGCCNPIVGAAAATAACVAGNTSSACGNSGGACNTCKPPAACYAPTGNCQ